MPALTLEELAALPDATVGFGQRLEVRDGREVRIPVMEGVNGAMWHADDDPMLIQDAEGRCWSVGRIDGVRYKRRQPQYESLEARLK